MAPAAFMRATTGESVEGIASANIGRPWVVGEPIQSMFSFTKNGTPCSGPNASPPSARSAALSADSASTTVTALSLSFIELVIYGFNSGQMRFDDLS